jgi:hypothetical protein
VDTRTRWIIGILLALVIGLGVALIIVAADDESGQVRTVTTERTPTRAEPTTTAAPTTTTTATTGTTGGTPVPGETTTAPDGQGGL